jgi:hypothetical protein
MNRDRAYGAGPSFSGGGARVGTMTKHKFRDAKLDLLKQAARELEDKPYDESLQAALMGAARAWAKAEREAIGPQTRSALDRDAARAQTLKRGGEDDE